MLLRKRGIKLLLFELIVVLNFKNILLLEEKCNNSCVQGTNECSLNFENGCLLLGKRMFFVPVIATHNLSDYLVIRNKTF